MAPARSPLELRECLWNEPVFHPSCQGRLRAAEGERRDRARPQLPIPGWAKPGTPREGEGGAPRASPSQILWGRAPPEAPAALGQPWDPPARVFGVKPCPTLWRIPKSPRESGFLGSDLAGLRELIHFPMGWVEMILPGHDSGILAARGPRAPGCAHHPSQGLPHLPLGDFPPCPHPQHHLSPSWGRIPGGFDFSLPGSSAERGSSW